MEEIRLSSKKKEAILKNVELLLQLYHNGGLGGETMPEDANPGLGSGTKEKLAIMVEPYLSLILCGEKTIESRFSIKKEFLITAYQKGI